MTDDTSLARCDYAGELGKCTEQAPLDTERDRHLCPRHLQMRKYLDRTLGRTGALT